MPERFPQCCGGQIGGAHQFHLHTCSVAADIVVPLVAARCADSFEQIPCPCREQDTLLILSASRATTHVGASGLVPLSLATRADWNRSRVSQNFRQGR
jgi:hypothetical protein